MRQSSTGTHVLPFSTGNERVNWILNIVSVFFQQNTNIYWIKLFSTPKTPILFSLAYNMLTFIVDISLFKCSFK